MNYSDYRFTLDVQVHQAQVSVPVMLGDTARRLFISLSDGRKHYYIADGCRAVLVAQKPDGTSIFNDCIIENNSTIVYQFTPNTTSAEGIVNCEIRLYGENRLITSAKFIIVVDAKVIRDEEILSESERTTLDNIIMSENARVGAERDRASAELAREKAEVVRSEAEKVRFTAESGRCDNETTRAEAEALRVTAENARANSEALRVIADEKRDDFLGDLEAAVDKIVETQEEILNGDAELIAKEEVIKAINETMLIANDFDTYDPHKALSAFRGAELRDIVTDNHDETAKYADGYYNGTGDGNKEITFFFVPKIIFLVQYTRQMARTNEVTTQSALHVIFPTSGKSYSSKSSTGAVVTTSKVNGSTVTLAHNVMSYVYDTELDYNAKVPIPDKEADGYGYWFYAFG
ncbi:MAG: hypothetical protein IKA62_06450 [Clostridia bacterium]|nr:hypothetical protein [Clostridia bacterium]